ncbi:hypothetical protein [Streptomyces sp. DSM 40750]|uniref:hypothetical protein n=1 Tax=Streptomyces sp. DSM 40750 TaxID=2801030 RepID=UPI00214AFD27|nr:hypothetical protein [Streptomyces sp. DSM 40750]UUU26682.1 hypothetical protein JIX55_44325 [Streptomyces sp. DSM 40750]
MAGISKGTGPVNDGRPAVPTRKDPVAPPHHPYKYRVRTAGRTPGAYSGPATGAFDGWTPQAYGGRRTADIRVTDR